MQYQRTSDKLTVIYLLDQSLSIPESRREAMVRYVNASIRDQRKSEKGDRAGVIVFGEKCRGGGTAGRFQRFSWQQSGKPAGS